MAADNGINVFGSTNHRNQQVRFGIKQDDRRRHMYVLGKSGAGKSTLLENMIIQDIQAGRGVCVVDPHGDLVEKVVHFIPPNRINDTIYFNPFDVDFPIAFNVMEQVDRTSQGLVASGLVGVFKKLWADSWGPRLEYILRNAILALLEHPGSTLLGVPRLFVDKDFRKRVIGTITDPVVKAFWEVEYAKYNQQFAVEAVAPIQNKVGQFLSIALVRNIIGQSRSSLDLRKVMDEKNILLLNLSKGRIGEDASALLGAMLITKLQLAAMSRVNTPESERNDFYLYVDEFQNFVTESFAGILSEARKYRLCITLAHQYIGQLAPQGSTTIRDAVFGNVGTMAVFRVGAEDAEFLKTEFEPTFTPADLVNLPNFNVYLKLMIDGVTSQPFSATTLPPFTTDLSAGTLDKVIKVTRERYSSRREDVEQKIISWSESALLQAAAEADEPKAPRVPPGPRFEAKCDNCGNTTTTPFEPDPSRPVFCPDCLRLFRAGKIAAPRKARPAGAAIPAADTVVRQPAQPSARFAAPPAQPAQAPVVAPAPAISLSDAFQKPIQTFSGRTITPPRPVPQPEFEKKNKN
jgi:CxxC-x17-CxxC domain-containing protein